MLLKLPLQRPSNAIVTPMPAQKAQKAQKLRMPSFIKECALLVIRGPLLNPFWCIFFLIFFIQIFLYSLPLIFAFYLLLLSFTHHHPSLLPSLPFSLLCLSCLLTAPTANDCDTISGRLTREDYPLTVPFSSLSITTVPSIPIHPSEAGPSECLQLFLVCRTILNVKHWTVYTRYCLDLMWPDLTWPDLISSSTSLSKCNLFLLTPLELTFVRN